MARERRPNLRILATYYAVFAFLIIGLSLHLNTFAVIGGSVGTTKLTAETIPHTKDAKSYELSIHQPRIHREKNL